VEWLKSLSSTKNINKVVTIFNKENMGISHASNQALDAIGDTFDFIIKIDNDCEIFATNWLARLLYIFEAHWQIILSPYVEGLVDNPGGTPRIAYKNFRKNLIGVTKHIGGIFTMAHKSAYKGFRWDEEDFLHSLQDTVFTQEVQKKGFICGYVEDMKCMHMDSTDGQKIKYPDYWEKRKYDRTHIYK
jgi:GT2 family glycosyltransferase